MKIHLITAMLASLVATDPTTKANQGAEEQCPPRETWPSAGENAICALVIV